MAPDSTAAGTGLRSVGGGVRATRQRGAVSVRRRNCTMSCAATARTSDSPPSIALCRRWSRRISSIWCAPIPASRCTAVARHRIITITWSAARVARRLRSADTRSKPGPPRWPLNTVFPTLITPSSCSVPAPAAEVASQAGHAGRRPRRPGSSSPGSAMRFPRAQRPGSCNAGPHRHAPRCLPRWGSPRALRCPASFEP